MLWAVPGNRAAKRHLALSIAFLALAIATMVSAVAVRLLLEFPHSTHVLHWLTALSVLGGTTPHVFHSFVVRLPDAQEMMAYAFSAIYVTRIASLGGPRDAGPARRAETCNQFACTQHRCH